MYASTYHLRKIIVLADRYEKSHDDFPKKPKTWQEKHSLIISSLWLVGWLASFPMRCIIPTVASPELVNSSSRKGKHFAQSKGKSTHCDVPFRVS